jgi:ABC-type transport system involved in multi-copper enzyme maturation permease subunit
MKMAALLKDSFREALDRKIFAAMLLLSGLLILFVVSISFRRITIEDELKDTTRILTWATGLNPHAGKAEYSIENFRQTNDAPEPWNGDYQFDWVVKVDSADKMPQVQMRNQSEIRRMVRDGMNYLKDVEVGENSSQDANQVRFTVTTHGTKVDDALAWRHVPVILFAVPLPFWHTSLREGVYFIENTLVGGLGAWVAVLVGVIVTASFIPNLLQKGAVDLIVTKPVRRPSLLIYKYIGGLIFVFFLTAFTILGVWAAIGVRTGVWATGFLYLIPAITFYFALLYSVSTLVAVYTRSAVVAILLTVAAWFGLWLNGTIHGALDGVRKASIEAENQVRKLTGAEKPSDETDDKAKSDDGKPWEVPHWVYSTSDFFYRVLPRTTDLNQLTNERVARGLLSESEYKTKGFDKSERPHWPEVFGVTAAFIALMLALSCWKFVRTDY